MRVRTYRSIDEFEREGIGIDGATWFIVWSVIDFPNEALLTALERTFPGVPVFGTTSFQGVFAPEGFVRGACVLVGEASDTVRMGVSACATDAQNARRDAKKACAALRTHLGRAPDLVVMHGTPGLEERLLEGIEDELGRDVVVYGGTAADDEIAGKWQVFGEGAIIGEGFVVAGLVTPDGYAGGFLGGYLPTQHAGKITRAEGRTVFTIDGRPAAQVYNEWAGGIVSAELGSGGAVLLKTNLSPIGRVIDYSAGMPVRLLSHPHEVLPRTDALNFFAELATGDEVRLMTGTPGALISRVERVVERALGRRTARPKGGILIFCGGCLAVMREHAPRVSEAFRKAAGDIPFIGVASFGEQGCFIGKRKSNRHGNLMCNVVLFM
jgi:hypothetical protein